MEKIDIAIEFLEKRAKEVDQKNRRYPDENTQDQISRAHGDGFIKGLQLAMKVLEVMNKH